MFSYIKEFVTHHKRKILLIGVVLGSTVVGSKFAQKRLIDWQEKETKDFLERSRKQQYFENSEKTCNQTIIFLSSTLRENILNVVNCEDVIKNLREGVGSKIGLWQELKLLVFTKVSLLIYCGSLLVIALRIQLNIIGGHIFCKAVLPETDYYVSSDFQEKYLSKCYYFLNEGVKEMHPIIQEKVHIALKDVTLKQNLSLQQVENIFWAIQSSINEDARNPLKNMPQLLYGSDFVTKEDNMFMKEIMLDTVDLLQSAEVIDIVSSCVNRGFSSLMDKVADFFSPQENYPAITSYPGRSQDGCNLKFTHPNNLSKPLAKVVPIVNGFGNSGSFEMPEAWISPLIYMDKIKVLGANIYESYCCPKS